MKFDDATTTDDRHALVLGGNGFIGRTSSGLSSATVTPSPRSTAGAASGSAIPTRFTPRLRLRHSWR